MVLNPPRPTGNAGGEAGERPAKLGPTAWALVIWPWPQASGPDLSVRRDFSAPAGLLSPPGLLSSPPDFSIHPDLQVHLDFCRRRGVILAKGPMNVLLFSMPDSFEHTPSLTMRMPNGALASLAGNVDPHHRVADRGPDARAARRARTRSSGWCATLEPDVVGLSVMTFQRRTARKIIALVRALRPGGDHRRRRLRPEPGARRLRGSVDAAST